MFFVGGFRASNAFPYVIEANDLEVEAFVEKHSSNAPWVSIMMALDFVMSDRDASTTTEDILQEVITRFVQYGICKTSGVHGVSKTSGAMDQLNKILLFFDKIRHHMTVDYQSLHLNPELIQFLADFLDGDIFVLEACENGRGYAITTHYSSSSANDGYERTRYFFIRLYGQYWGSGKARDFNDDDFSEAAMTRIGHVIGSYLTKSIVDTPEDTVAKETNSKADTNPGHDVIDFNSVFEVPINAADGIKSVNVDDDLDFYSAIDKERSWQMF